MAWSMQKGVLGDIHRVTYVCVVRLIIVIVSVDLARVCQKQGKLSQHVA